MPLIAVAGLLALLVVPAAAQAHHVDSKAECIPGGSQPTLKLKAYFKGFSTKQVYGKVSVDGDKKFDGAVPVTWTGNDGEWVWTQPATAGKSYTVTTSWWWKKGTDGETHKYVTCPEPPKPPKNPGIEIVKDGPATKYVDDHATFTYKVTNTGDVELSNPTVTDDKCAPVDKVPDGDTRFDPDDVWTFTCTTTITDAMGDQLVNVAEACAEMPGKEVCDDDEHTTDIPKPAISLVKTGAATANAGETFTYSFAARNEGNVHAVLDDVVLTDNRCQTTLTRVDPNLADPTFDPGDVWNYTCTVVAPAGPAQVDNLAEVCGTYTNPGVPPMTVCAEDTHTFTVPPPAGQTGNPPTGVPPMGNPPAGTAPGSTPPGAGTLPETIASGRARLRGPSGCVKQAFRARVRGRSITAVTFFVDGKRVKRITGERRSYTIKVNPRRYGFGRHRVVARVEFLAESGTRARRLPLTFRRCAQGAVAPRFTG